jgi:ABC-type multidrug transport system ATPase subunit
MPAQTPNPRPAVPTPATASAPIAQAINLAYSWGSQPLFDDLNLSIGPGVTLVHGDEQTGKTTLLRLLGGEIVPRQGRVVVAGAASHDQPDLFAQQVFWAHPMDPALDQTSPNEWFNALATRYPAFDRPQLARLVVDFDLEPHAAKPLYMLSTGSRRKVSLCAAFASGAPLLLIDQPFAALDAPSIRLLRELFQALANQTQRACVLADYEAPQGVPLAGSLEL